MTAIIIISAITMLLSVLVVCLENKGKLTLKYIMKTVASLCFVFVGILAVINTKFYADWQMLVIAALVLGMLGDIFLSSESICKSDAVDSLNLSGLLFFLIGHVVFIAWLLRFTDTFNYWLLAFCVALPALMFLLVKLKVLQPGKATVPCIAYAAVIGLMLAAAINVFLQLGDETVGKLILAGGILFTVSDCCLAVFNFGGTKPNWLKFLYMPTYYAAQLLFALTILY